ncbi:plantaricin C family lantibiotic [Streptococcus henryi]|uniref:plantaricin C family lantibiotic n=1 Tax=Streptococcus henryi TaxID=439219 RepID=UPI0003829C1C|nr:plantaricin C family lantibiotic [Streptococcus henryi]
MVKKNNSYNNVSWIEEIQDQNFNDDVFGACSTNTFTLSDYLGNNGGWCTISVECMAWCI